MSGYTGRLRLPTPRELFDGNDAVDRYERLKSVLADTITKGIDFKRDGGFFDKEKGFIPSERSLMRASLSKAGLSADVVKEWELGNPIPTTPIQYEGIIPYSVEAALLMIIPKELKLRNSTTRQKQEGAGFGYRRITSVSNSKPSNRQSLAFISNGAQGTTLNRPPYIQYTGDATFSPYVDLGASDAVAIQQQFASQGWIDASTLSATALLWAYILGEEWEFLTMTSSALSVVGASASAAAGGTATGLPASGTATSILVTFSSPNGESKAITATGSVTTSASEGITLTPTGFPANAIAVNTYVEVSSVWYKGSTVLTNGTTPSVFGVVTTPPSTTADNGSYPNYEFGGTLVTNASADSVMGFNGLIQTAQTLGGAQDYLGGAITLDTFPQLLQSQYVTQGADTDVIYGTGALSIALWDLLQNNPTTTGYRINTTSGETGVIQGGAVAGVVNPATGKVVDFSVHRYMPAGVAIGHSTSVPWSDSGVTSTMKFVSAADTVVYDWPQIGMSLDKSIYSFGTLIFEAPVLDFAVTGITNG